ncbi:hypothetical protein ES703_43195 [subsurface metagenome]
MNYNEIDKIMVSKSLASDPAFNDVTISIEPIPSFNGCPLGLYYPGTATIILPPNATEAALLHELGHRHGHCYHDNLSEKYAEDFRKSHQGGKALLYAGNHFENLPKFGALFEEGEKGVVEIAFNRPLTMDELYGIKSQFYSYSEPPPRFFYGESDVPFVRIEFTQGINWLVIIGSVMAGVVVLTAGSLGYALYKTAKELPWVVPVSLFAFGAYIVLRAATREAKKLSAGR